MRRSMLLNQDLMDSFKSLLLESKQQLSCRGDQFVQNHNGPHEISRLDLAHGKMVALALLDARL